MSDVHKALFVTALLVLMTIVVVNSPSYVVSGATINESSGEIGDYYAITEYEGGTVVGLALFDADTCIDIYRERYCTPLGLKRTKDYIMKMMPEIRIKGEYHDNIS